MILTYFRQAWQLLRQNKLFSTIYIVGTALAIASTTIFAIIYYARLAPVYPEYQKNRIMTLSTMGFDSNFGNYMQITPGVSYKALQECFYNLRDAEAVAAYIDERQLRPVFMPGSKSSFNISLRYADPAYFNIINYEFLAGSPFSQDDFDAISRKIAISDQLANKLGYDFAEAVGRTINIDFSDYEVCGVFREGSAINNLSYAQAIAPCSHKFFNGLISPYQGCNVLGLFSVLILTDNKEVVKAEVEDYFRKYSSSEMNGRKIHTFDQPRPAIINALSVNPQNEVDIMGVIRHYVLILLTLLIVPALNLSGMIAGRMDSRSGEMGIRKSFGATGGKLLRQVLWENLLLTLIGGIFGLILTWLLMSTDVSSSFVSIMSITNRLNDPGVTVRFTNDMYFAPAIFGLSFLFCVLLNVMSAIIPTWSALRRPIVKSLN